MTKKEKVFSDFYVVCMNGGIETRYRVSATSIKDAVRRFADKYSFGCDVGQYVRVEDFDGNILFKRHKLVYRPYYDDMVKFVDALFEKAYTTSFIREINSEFSTVCGALNKKYPDVYFMVNFTMYSNPKTDRLFIFPDEEFKIISKRRYELVEFQQKDSFTLISNKK
jgi:hypothetical protein